MKKTLNAIQKDIVSKDPDVQLEKRVMFFLRTHRDDINAKVAIRELDEKNTIEIQSWNERRKLAEKQFDDEFNQLKNQFFQDCIKAWKEMGFEVQ